MTPLKKIVKEWYMRMTAFFEREFPGAAQLPKSSLGRLLFVGLLLLGVFFHSAGLGWGLSRTVKHGPPHHDEPRMIRDITETWEDYKTQFGDVEVYLSVYYFRFFARPIILLGQQLHWDNPQNDVFRYAVPRGVASAFGIIGLVAIYLLGTKLGGVRAGLFSLAFLAVMPGHWYYSQLIKGDIIVTTLITLLLLASIFIVERGSRFSYIFGGVVVGLALASKISVFPVMPIILVAHCIAAYQHRSWRYLVSLNAVFGLVVLLFVFAVLYPYPYANFPRWLGFMTDHDHFVFHVHWFPTPASFLETWHNYNGPVRPFMDMVFGKPLHYIFPIAAAWFVVLTGLAIKARRGMPYILTFLTALILYHSYSFFEPQGDRYLLPLTTFLALFAGLLVAGVWPLRDTAKKYVVVAGVAGLLIFFATLRITWAYFPAFALEKEIRESTVDFLHERAKKGETIGEFEPAGRQSLPFNRDIVTLERLSTGGENGRIYTDISPAYVVTQVEPWNYDQAFRYQLGTPELRQGFDEFLKSYTHVARFGKEPMAFGEKLPRGLFSPMYDVYMRTELQTQQRK